jgi:hypothetical protein
LKSGVNFEVVMPHHSLVETGVSAKMLNMIGPRGSVCPFSTYSPESTPSLPWQEQHEVISVFDLEPADFGSADQMQEPGILAGLLWLIWARHAEPIPRPNEKLERI